MNAMLLGAGTILVALTRTQSRALLHGPDYSVRNSENVVGWNNKYPSWLAWSVWTYQYRGATRQWVEHKRGSWMDARGYIDRQARSITRPACSGLPIGTLEVL